jgi:hypothetical protein
LRKVRRTDAALNAAVMAAGAFLVHEQRQALFKSEFGIVGIVELFGQALPKGGQVQLGEFVEQGLGQHGEPH